MDEALKIGLRGDELKKFAQSYIAQNKAKRETRLATAENLTKDRESDEPSSSP